MPGADDTIVIVGAGPVGLAAAIEFHRRGRRFRIIDRSPGPREHSRALAVQPTTLHLMEPSGVSRHLLEQGNRIRRMRIMAAQTVLATLDFANLGPPYDFLLVLPQSRTERIMIAWLAERGVQVEWNTELTGLALQGETARLQITREGTTPHHHGGAGRRCRWRRSPVRTFAGIGFAGERMQEEFSLADINPDGGVDPHEAVVRFSERGILGAIPIDARTVRYIADGTDLEQRLPPQARGAPVEWHSQFAIAYHLAERFARPPVYLAGDAAHIHSPAGGRGMNLGIEDACWLAWLESEGRLGDYAAARERAARGVVDMTRRLTGAIATRNRFKRSALQLAMRIAFSFAPVQTMALRRMTGADSEPAPWL